ERRSIAGYPPALAHDGRSIVEVVEAYIRHDEIERLVGEWHGGAIRFVKSHIRRPPRSKLLARSCQRRAPWIDTVHVSGGAQAVRQLNQRESGAAPHVERDVCAGQWYVLEQEQAEHC